ncbi:hypothetical protein VNI00_003966 [Paramarasmius palmivorus]|uniref:Metallo-beta-lactamase domain-containing protein n=1 Tax=Paramarasmius palmivorus TaxID=297713 RepID=A0AAW0DPE6_9AGAR
MTSSSLKAVDRLTITFLVDNSIEWFTKLPPGFTHEIKQHLQPDHHPGIDPVTGTPILNFNHFCCGAHGFSALIQTESAGGPVHYTLFDTGPDSTSLVRNISAMQIPISKINRVVTSHWHSDHTGGLLSFLELRNQGKDRDVSSRPTCVVDVHPDRPVARGIAPGPSYDKVVCRLMEDPSFEAIAEAGGLVEEHSEGHAVAQGTVWVSGEIPRVTDFESAGLLGAMRWKDGQWVSEPHIMDERYAAIDVTGKGLVIFSACSHAGIVNVVKHAVDTFGRPIHMVIGGLHLAGVDNAPRIQPTVDFFSKTMRPSPNYILPMHCSGFQAKVALEQALGEGCVPAGVGIKIEVEADPEHEKRLSSATYQ